MVEEITTTERFKELINGDTPVIVDFYADWCGPCKVISPIFQRLSGMPEYSPVTFVKVNTETQEDVAREWSIRVMPTFILFHKGKKVGDTLGARPAPLEELVRKGIAPIQPPPTETTETAPVSKEAPVPREAPVPKEVPVSKEAPVSKETPVPKEVPVSKEAPVSKETPVPKEAPVSKETLVPKEAPVSKETLIPKEAPVSKDTLVPKEAPVSKEAPVPKEVPAPKEAANQGQEV